MRVGVFWKLRLTIRTLVNRTESSYSNDQGRGEGKDACKSVAARSDTPPEKVTAKVKVGSS